MFGGFHLSSDRSRWLALRSVEGFEFRRWQVAERLVQTSVVEPAHVLDDGELQLRSSAPHPVCNELGLEAVEEALGHRVVVGVADRADGRQDAIVCERLGVIDARVLTAAI